MNTFTACRILRKVHLARLCKQGNWAMWLDDENAHPYHAGWWCMPPDGSRWRYALAPQAKAATGCCSWCCVGLRRVDARLSRPPQADPATRRCTACTPRSVVAHDHGGAGRYCTQGTGRDMRQTPGHLQTPLHLYAGGPGYVCSGCGFGMWGAPRPCECSGFLMAA